MKIRKLLIEIPKNCKDKSLWGEDVEYLLNIFKNIDKNKLSYGKNIFFNGKKEKILKIVIK